MSGGFPARRLFGTTMACLWLPFPFLLPTVLLLGWMRASGVPFLLLGRDGWISVALGCLTALYNWALLSLVHSICSHWLSRSLFFIFFFLF